MQVVLYKNGHTGVNSGLNYKKRQDVSKLNIRHNQLLKKRMFNT